jgi:hypothetical protein
MAFTLADVRTWLQDNDRSSASSRSQRIYDKIANDARMRIAQAGLWDFDRRVERLTYAAPYSTGTATVSLSTPTAVTGAGGAAWTTAMIGLYVRFNGEDLLYRITARPGATTLTIETYRGPADLSAVTYEIVDVRQALPSRFRQLVNPLINLESNLYLEPVALDTLKMFHMDTTSTGRPLVYAIETAEVSGVPTPYLWIQPAPSDKRALELPMYVWPAEATAGTDGFYLPAEAEMCFREVCLALLKREQGDNDWQAQVGLAVDAIRHQLGCRQVGRSVARAEWDPDRDSRQRDYFGPYRDGERRYS